MTIKDIAKESGYAVGTVSRVLNNRPGVSEEARIRVMEVVNKYHFRLNSNAKHLKQQENSGIAIIVKGRRNMLFSSILEKLNKKIKEIGLSSVIDYISEDDDEVEEALQLCRERQPIGIIFLGSNKENFRNGFGDIEVPCVMVTNTAEGLDFDNLSSVSIDDKIAAKKAIEYLIELGHKNIGIIGGEMAHSNPARLRYLGCVEAFEENNLKFDVDKQYTCSYFNLDDGYNAMVELLNKDKSITAVFAMSDVTAIGAVRAAKDKGYRVPDDISVIGFDGIETGQYLVPRLTTISQPEDMIVENSVLTLMNVVNQSEYPEHLVVPFKLLEGESTKRI